MSIAETIIKTFCVKFRIYDVKFTHDLSTLKNESLHTIGSRNLDNQNFLLKGEKYQR